MAGAGHKMAEFMGRKPHSTLGADGRRRVVIAAVTPELEGGRFAIKRTVGERVLVEADILADGHDALSAVLRYRPSDQASWLETPMTAVGNDRWRGSFEVTQLGVYQYSVTGWVDHFKSWQSDLVKKHKAGQELEVELLIGARLVAAAVSRGPEEGRSCWRGMAPGTAESSWRFRRASPR
jgi:starch synthase (maltosyl-transferring)